MPHAMPSTPQQNSSCQVTFLSSSFPSKINESVTPKCISIFIQINPKRLHYQSNIITYIYIYDIWSIYREEIQPLLREIETSHRKAHHVKQSSASSEMNEKTCIYIYVQGMYVYMEWSGVEWWGKEGWLEKTQCSCGIHVRLEQDMLWYSSMCLHINNICTSRHIYIYIYKWWVRIGSKCRCLSHFPFLLLVEAFRNRETWIYCLFLLLSQP